MGKRKSNSVMDPDSKKRKIVKKKPSVPFTEDEVGKLLSLVAENISVIECQNPPTVGTPSIFWKKKAQVWDTIASEFQASGLGFRDSAALKNKWVHLKMEARKQAATATAAHTYTGGGYRDVELPGISQKVLDLCDKTSMRGHVNRPDDDELFTDPSTAINTTPPTGVDLHSVNDPDSYIEYSPLSVEENHTSTQAMDDETVNDIETRVLDSSRPIINSQQLRPRATTSQPRPRATTSQPRPRATTSQPRPSTPQPRPSVIPPERTSPRQTTTQDHTPSPRSNDRPSPTPQRSNPTTIEQVSTATSQVQYFNLLCELARKDDLRKEELKEQQDEKHRREMKNLEESWKRDRERKEEIHNMKMKILKAEQEYKMMLIEKEKDEAK